MRHTRIALVHACCLSVVWGCSVLVDSGGLSDAAVADEADASAVDDAADAPFDAGVVSEAASPIDGASDVADAARTDDALAPIGEWLFEELPPLDTSGNDHHGRVVGTPTLAADGGVRGGAMVVYSPSDGVIVDSLGLSAFPSSGTLAMVLWPDGPRLEAGTPGVFDGWGPTRNHVFWRQMQSVSVTLQFALQSNTLGDASAPYAWAVNYDFAPQTWTHVALTWDTVANVATLYINRMEASRSAIIAPFAPTEQVVRIGGMAGRYDEVRLYDRPLSKTEVAALP